METSACILTSRPRHHPQVQALARREAVARAARAVPGRLRLDQAHLLVLLALEAECARTLVCEQK